MDSPEDRALLESIFGRLRDTGYEIRSCKTSHYNCISYAVGVEHIPWDPFNEPYTYWPEGIAADGRIESLVAAYRTEGFEVCTNGSLEAGIEKIAIYGVNGEWQHAAVQRQDGLWASKCGVLQDIEHKSLEGICCVAYGDVQVYMARKRRSTE